MFNGAVCAYIYPWRIGESSDTSGESWVKVLRILHSTLENEPRPISLELHLGKHFILDAEVDFLTDELDALIIQRCDELRLNFGEVFRVRVIVLSP